MLIALLVLCGASMAHAQSSIGVSRTQFRIIREQERPSGQYPRWLNREDCLNADPSGEEGTYIEVSPRLPKIGNRLQLEVWVGIGADCADADERRETGNCWRVLSVVPRVNNVSYLIDPRRVIARGSDVTEAVCDTEVQWSTTFFFLLFEGDELLANATWEETQVDTQAPAPPLSVSADGGENALFLDWEVPLEQEDSDAEGFRLYCVPGTELASSGTGGGAGSPTGGASAGGVGGTSTGGNGASAAGGLSSATGAGPGLNTSGGMGGAPAATCSGGGLTPGEFPPEEYFCGEVSGRAARRGSTESTDENPDVEVSIENGQTYAVGVAATDQVGNVGKLSRLACGTPEPVITFFERYRQSGGRAGGGFCHWQPARRSSRGLLLAAFAAFLIVFLRRRRIRSC